MSFFRNSLQFLGDIFVSFANSRFSSWVKKGWGGFSFARLEAVLSTFVSLLFRLGALALIAGIVVMLWKISRYEGYTIESFLVCQPLTQKGFDGIVVARKLQDEYQAVKKIAASIKEDSVKMSGGEEDPELNVAVLGVGLSLKSIGYHLRDLLGRQNNLIRGEITIADSTLALTLRMTDFEPKTFQEDLAGGERRAISRLLRMAAEEILGKTDPYRLAIYYDRNLEFEKGLAIARQMLRDRPAEQHWALLAWGAILEDQGNPEIAAVKFRESIRIKPDFALPYMRLANCLQALNQVEEAIPLIEKAIELNPEEIWYINAYASALNRMKRFEEADRAMERCLADIRDPSAKAVFLLNWAEVKANSGNPEAAKSLVAEAIELSDPNGLENAVSRLFLGLLSNDAGAIEKAAKEALAIDPNNGMARQAIMRAHFIQQDYSKVIDLARQIHPNPQNKGHLQQMFNLAAMAFNFSAQYDSALVYIQKSIAENPNTGAPYSTLGETYAFLGDRPRFFEYLEIAFKKGMSPSAIGPEDEPYTRFRHDPEYLALIRKYSDQKTN